MTPPASQACGCWGLTSTYGTTRTDADEGPVSSPASWTTRGKDHPTARLSGPGPRKVWHRVQELARRARRRLPCRGANRDTGSLPGTARTPSMTSSKTPPASSMPSILSSSLATPQVRCVAASSKTRPVTAGAKATPSTWSAIFCAPRATSSPHANKNESVRPPLGLCAQQLRAVQVVSRTQSFETLALLTRDRTVNLRPHVEQELSVTRHHIHQLTNVRSSTQALMIPLGTIIPERQAYTSK